MAFGSVANLSLAKRVAVLATIFLLPLAVLGYFLVVEKRELIAFSAKEVVGREVATLLAPGAKVDAAAAAARLGELIVLASDKSNLTLDPDLDTYYLMDVAVNQ